MLRKLNNWIILLCYISNTILTVVLTMGWKYVLAICSSAQDLSSVVFFSLLSCSPRDSQDWLLQGKIQVIDVYALKAFQGLYCTSEEPWVVWSEVLRKSFKVMQVHEGGGIYTPSRVRRYYMYFSLYKTVKIVRSNKQGHARKVVLGVRGSWSKQTRKKTKNNVEAMNRYLEGKEGFGHCFYFVGAWLCSCCLWTVTLSRTSLNGKSLLEWELSLLIVHLKPCSFPYLRKTESCRTGSITWNSDPWSSWHGLTVASSFQGCPQGGGFRFLMLSPWVF